MLHTYFPILFQFLLGRLETFGVGDYKGHKVCFNSS